MAQPIRTFFPLSEEELSKIVERENKRTLSKGFAAVESARKKAVEFAAKSAEKSEYNRVKKSAKKAAHRFAKKYGLKKKEEKKLRKLLMKFSDFPPKDAEISIETI